jgi:hypothetical protein
MGWSAALLQAVVCCPITTIIGSLVGTPDYSRVLETFAADSEGGPGLWLRTRGIVLSLVLEAELVAALS